MIIRSTITAAGVAGLLLSGCADREREIEAEAQKPEVTTGAEFEREAYPVEPEERPTVPEPPPAYEPEREMEPEMRPETRMEMEERPESGMALEQPAEDLSRYEGREPIGTLRGQAMAAPMPEGEEPGMAKTTAISMRFPPGTVVRIVEPQTSRAVLVRITAHPRGMPPADIILSPAAARELGVTEGTRADVRIDVLEMGTPMRRQQRMHQQMMQEQMMREQMMQEEMRQEQMRKQQEMQEQQPDRNQ